MEYRGSGHGVQSLWVTVYYGYNLDEERSWQSAGVDDGVRWLLTR